MHYKWLEWLAGGCTLPTLSIHPSVLDTLLPLSHLQSRSLIHHRIDRLFTVNTLCLHFASHVQSNPPLRSHREYSGIHTGLVMRHLFLVMKSTSLENILSLHSTRTSEQKTGVMFSLFLLFHASLASCCVVVFELGDTGWKREKESRKKKMEGACCRQRDTEKHLSERL